MFAFQNLTHAYLLVLAAEMRAPQFWDSPFPTLCETKDLIEFYVIDVQLEGQFGRVS